VPLPLKDSVGVWSLVNKTRKALARAMDRPHVHFLGWHREHVFKHKGCRPLRSS
jgi:hypothetical protein